MCLKCHQSFDVILSNLWQTMVIWRISEETVKIYQMFGKQLTKNHQTCVENVAKNFNRCGKEDIFPSEIIVTSCKQISQISKIVV